MSLTFKFVFIGDAGTGKTAINHKFITNQFEETPNTTIGVIFSCKQFYSHKYKRQIKIHFWDTAGRERFRSIVPMYYRGSSVILLVFDVSNRQSFQNVIDYWINKIKDENCFKIYLIGNKKDLTRQVCEQEARGVAEQYGFEYKEISTKCDNLEPLLTEIIDSIYLRMAKSEITLDKLKFYGVNVDHSDSYY